MTASLVALVLPYLIAILLKLSSVIIDPSVMRDALQRLVLASGNSPNSIKLSADQQEVIIKHIAHSSLKWTTVITAFTSSFAAVAVVLDSKGWVRSAGMVTVFFLLIMGAGLLWWVYPKAVGYFVDKGSFGLEKGTLVVIAFCGYDVILGILSYLSATLSLSQLPGKG